MATKELHRSCPRSFASREDANEAVVIKEAAKKSWRLEKKPQEGILKILPQILVFEAWKNACMCEGLLRELRMLILNGSWQ